MHVISHLAGANLLRHAEGATLLAIVTVRDLGKNKTTSFASVRSWLHWYPRTSGYGQAKMVVFTPWIANI